jgi:hypothetical protein
MPILLLLALAACIGQHRIASHRATTFDCEVLIKKQTQQFKKAKHHARTDHRRKLPFPKAKTQATVASSPSGGFRKFTTAIEDSVQAAPAYSPSLVLSRPDVLDPNSIFHNELMQNGSLAVPYPSIGSVPISKSDPVFEAFTNDKWIWPAILFGATIGILALNIFHNQAKMLTRWAKDNKWKARSTLAIMKVGAYAGFMFLGDNLYNSGIAVPEFVKIPTLAVLASAFVFYPSKYFSPRAPAFRYRERKFYDATIFAAGAIVMLFTGNQYAITQRPADPVQTVARVTFTDSRSNAGSETFNNISIVKKQFKQKVKALQGDPKKEITRSNKTILTVVAVLVSIALTFGIAAISCSIACSGAEVAALVVSAGGVALVVWGLVATIRAIHKRPTKKRTIPPESAA